MRVLRLSLVAATAIIAAACGDKVTVAGPSSNALKIESVLVAPSSATISVGQTVQLTAAVNADAGVTATVTWSTSSSAAATVSQSGLVAGVASSPGVAVCATASASNAASVENCATVVVQPASIVTPAVIQIASITTQAGGLNAPVPVPPAGVAGQINVSVNVNPGTEKMDSVVVMVNGKSAATQSFTSAQAAALRSAANGAADQALQQTLVFTINTAAYSATTGAVSYANGASTISVAGYGHQGTSPATNTTSQGVALLFANADAWVVSQVIGTGTAKVANDAGGFAHTTGAVAVSAVPVLYSGLGIVSATVNFGSTSTVVGGCDDSPIGQRSIALTAPATGTFAWTATFADASQTTNTNNATNRGTVSSYEFSAALCPVANAGGGEGPFIAASQYTNTNSGPVGFALGSTIPIVRLDNRAPMSATSLGAAANGTQAIPGFALTGASCPATVPATGNYCLAGRTGNWINDAVAITATSSTAGNAIFQSGTGVAGQLGDGGVSGIVVTANITGGALGTTATSLTNSTTLAESAANNTYTATYTFADALGNTTVAATGSAQIMTFGVDRTAPTLTLAASPKNNTAYATPAAPAVAAGFLFAATDNTTTVGAAPSGFFNLGATPLTMSETARNALTTTWWCPASATYQKTLAAGGVCATWPGSGANQNFSANLNTSANAVGNNYFTTVATVTDQAGNTSAAANNLYAVDAVAPVIGGISFPPFFTAGGSGTFTSAITTTGLDIAGSLMNLSYGAPGLGLFDGNTNAAFAPTSAAGGARLWQPVTVVDAFNAATLQTSAPFTVVVNPVLTNVQAANASAGTNPAGAGIALTSVNAYATNQPATLSAVSTSAITGASLPVSAAITNTGIAGAGPVNFLICATGNGLAAACANPPAALVAATVNVSLTAAVLAGCGGLACPTAVAITAVAEGTASVFQNPFSSVQFWAYDPTAGNTEGWRLISTVTNASTVTDGGGAVPNGRNWQFSTVWTPNTATAPDATVATVYKVVAIGITGTNLPLAQQGMALATPLGGVTVTVNP